MGLIKIERILIGEDDAVLFWGRICMNVDVIMVKIQFFYCFVLFDFLIL